MARVEQDRTDILSGSLASKTQRVRDPGLPDAQGLYDPALEKDSCGVGFVALHERSVGGCGMVVGGTCERLALAVQHKTGRENFRFHGVGLDPVQFVGIVEAAALRGGEFARSLGDGDVRHEFEQALGHERQGRTVAGTVHGTLVHQCEELRMGFALRMIGVDDGFLARRRVRMVGMGYGDGPFATIGTVALRRQHERDGTGEFTGGVHRDGIAPVFEGIDPCAREGGGVGGIDGILAGGGEDPDEAGRQGKTARLPRTFDSEVHGNRLDCVFFPAWQC